MEALNITIDGRQKRSAATAVKIIALKMSSKFDFADFYNLSVQKKSLCKNTCFMTIVSSHIVIFHVKVVLIRKLKVCISNVLFLHI